MIVGLRKQVEEKVPDKGAFQGVYEREEVTELVIGLSHLILKVINVGVPGHEDMRYLDFGAVKYPEAYGTVSTVGFGDTQDIIAKLQEDGLVDKLMKKVPEFVEEIDYVRRHPYG